MPLLDRIASRLFRLPAARTGYTRRPERVPMRDGVELLAEHWAPETGHPLGTVLVRTPYGRHGRADVGGTRVLASRGYHVLVQSVRGTFGSGGVFDPMVHEARDGQDTVAWLRGQDWFDGRLATWGASYLGWTQWTLLADPPPELRAAVVLVGPHDFAASVYGSGAFALHGFASWSDLVAHQERPGLAGIAAMAGARRRLAPAFAGLPLAAAVETATGGAAPWFRDWVSHDDLGDPFWDDRRAAAGLATATVPTLLIGGWQDLFLEQTMAQYAALRDRGVDVALTVGPWTHIGVGTRGAATVARETLGWLDEHLAGATGRTRRAPVRVARTGPGRATWLDLPAWPPPTTPHALRLTAGGLAPGDTPERPAPDAAPGSAPGGPLASFRYDPADPTPTVGGRLLTPTAGRRDNAKLVARPDVVTFTGPVLTTPVDVAGSPVVELDHATDGPWADVFVRLCDVDERGTPRNVSDGMRRLDHHSRPLEITLDPCFHRFAAGHRLMVLVAGGAHPRFQRNNGTGEPPADATGLRPVTHTIRGGTVTVPVAGGPAAGGAPAVTPAARPAPAPQPPRTPAS